MAKAVHSTHLTGAQPLSLKDTKDPKAKGVVGAKSPHRKSGKHCHREGNVEGRQQILSGRILGSESKIGEQAKQIEILQQQMEKLQQKMEDNQFNVKRKKNKQDIKDIQKDMFGLKDTIGKLEGLFLYADIQFENFQKYLMPKRQVLGIEFFISFENTLGDYDKLKQAIEGIKTSIMQFDVSHDKVDIFKTNLSKQLIDVFNSAKELNDGLGLLQESPALSSVATQLDGLKGVAFTVIIIIAHLFLQTLGLAYLLKEMNRSKQEEVNAAYQILDSIANLKKFGIKSFGVSKSGELEAIINKNIERMKRKMAKMEVE